MNDNEYRAEVIALLGVLPPRLYFVADLVQATEIVDEIRAIALVGSAAGKRFHLARHRIWWICYYELDLNLSQIGRLFNRDRTTISSGVHRYRDKLALTDTAIRDEIKQIAGEIFRGEREEMEEAEEAAATDAE